MPSRRRALTRASTYDKTYESLAFFIYNFVCVKAYLHAAICRADLSAPRNREAMSRLFWSLWLGLVLSKRQGYSDHCDIRRLISFSSNDLFFPSRFTFNVRHFAKGYVRLGCKIGPDAGKSVKRSQIFSESADMSD